MIKSITSVKVTNKRVLLRAGFDVPLKQTKEKEKFIVVDDTRLKATMPTIKYILNGGGKLIIISHLDRPKGQWDLSKSMWPIAEDLARIMGLKAVQLTDTKLPVYDIPHLYFLKRNILEHDYSSLSKKIKKGEVLFLENIRFYKGEDENDEEFCKVLAEYGDLYVDDAFSNAHRKSASMFGLAKLMKSYAGTTFLHEIHALDKVLKKPHQPMVVIMGGAKIAGKVDTIHSLAKLADQVLIGGAIGNAFIKAKGYEIGKSKVAEESLARELLRNYRDKIVLPIDLVVAKSVESEARTVTLNKILPSDMIFDIGPQTITKFSSIIKDAKTIVWNGPLGLIEVSKFSFGSKSIAQAVANVSKGPAFGVVGGGETLETVDMAKVAQFIDHLSTAGGAMLDYLAGKKLPAIQALECN